MWCHTVKINSIFFPLFMCPYHRKNIVPSPLLKMYVPFQQSICIYAIPQKMITKLSSISVSVPFPGKLFIHPFIHSVNI